jgi:hypothetical protein
LPSRVIAIDPKFRTVPFDVGVRVEMLDHRLMAEALHQRLVFFLAARFADLFLVRHPIFGAERTSGGRLSVLGVHYVIVGPVSCRSIKAVARLCGPSGMHNRGYSTRLEARKGFIKANKVFSE